jgi:hypothetical protein
MGAGEPPSQTTMKKRKSGVEEGKIEDSPSQLIDARSSIDAIM